MNFIVSLLIIAGVLFLIEPVQAGSNLLVNNFIPSVKKSSFNVPLLDEVMASSRADIESVDGSKVKGVIRLIEIPENLDTDITVEVSGLRPGGQYIAIYHQNFNCQREINSVEKSVKGAFFADEEGKGKVEDRVKDSRNRIGSVSIRRAEDFGVVACGRV